MQTLTFNQTSFDIIDQNNQIWLKSVQLAQALGYSRDDAISRIYERNQDEFTDKMVDTVNLTVSGNLQTSTRIFSLRGAHLIAMFARTKIAKEFRKWVLDVLEHHTQSTQITHSSSTEIIPQQKSLELNEDEVLHIVGAFTMAVYMNETIRFLEKPMRLLGTAQTGRMYSEGFEYQKSLKEALPVFEKILTHFPPEGGKHSPIYGYTKPWDKVHHIFPQVKERLTY